MTRNPYDLQEKYAMLGQVRAQLKAEFIGIDPIIDRMIDVATPWFLFPHIQERPLIINLWGLTGVGKTSLVNRFVQLIGFENWFFKFDLGDSYDREYNIKKILQNIFPHHNGSPLVLAFDEFQLARTLNSSEEEIDKGFLRNVWEILDHGKLMTTMSCYAQSSVFQLIHLLRYCMSGGTVIKNGIVVEGETTFLEVMKRHRPLYIHADSEQPTPKGPVRVIPPWSMEEIFELNLGKFKTQFEMEQFLNTLDGPELVIQLQELYQQSLGQQIMDCSKSLVFVMGNLDEAFPMSHDLNLDISPDEFHRQSLEININNIREALTKRFRPEQISRLGSCHLIYPAFNSDSFKQLIQRELQKISNRAEQEGLKLHFDPSIEELLFNEGVFPTQGVRPLYTTIHELIGSQTGKLLVERLSLGNNLDEVSLHWDGKYLRKIYSNAQGETYQAEEKPELSVHKLRKPRKDELQAVTAVHEAGHALISIGLMHRVPESIHSITSSNEMAGFTKNAIGSNCISFRELKLRLTMLMGGLAAEELIFGKDHVTLGSESDLRRATKLVNEMLLESGMGEVPGYFESPMSHPNVSLPPTERHRQLASTWLKEAHEQALSYLAQQKEWLLQVADYLAEHPVMDAALLKEMARQYATGFDLAELKNPADSNFYRNRLKEAVQELVSEPEIRFNSLKQDFKAA